MPSLLPSGRPHSPHDSLQLAWTLDGTHVSYIMWQCYWSSDIQMLCFSGIAYCQIFQLHYLILHTCLFVCSYPYIGIWAILYLSHGNLSYPCCQKCCKILLWNWNAKKISQPRVCLHSVYLTSCMWPNLPSFNLHTATDQRWEVGNKAIHKYVHLYLSSIRVQCSIRHIPDIPYPAVEYLARRNNFHDMAPASVPV